MVVAGGGGFDLTAEVSNSPQGWDNDQRKHENTDWEQLCNVKCLGTGTDEGFRGSSIHKRHNKG